jgi:hypothetical protein
MADDGVGYEMAWRLGISLLLVGVVIFIALEVHVRRLPPHHVASNTSLAPKEGRRIEIHVRDAHLTPAQCKTLIAHYRSQAAPGGQVSVHKPSTWLDGTLQPWCVENFDGHGVFFNDELFR